MSIVIDSTYFEGGLLAVPNSVSNSQVTGNVPTTTVTLNSYIDKYEEELLKNAIGYTNYEALKTAIEANPTLELPENSIWNDLVNGKIYTYESKDVEWKGLKQTSGTIKKSLIANYVFYHYLSDDTHTYTSTGVVTNDPKNAEKQTPNLRLTQVWREFIQMYQYGYDTHPVISTNSAGMVGTDYYVSQNNAVRSLYQFLRDNDNYGEYNFVVYDNRNQFGI